MKKSGTIHRKNKQKHCIQFNVDFTDKYGANKL